MSRTAVLLMTWALSSAVRVRVPDEARPFRGARSKAHAPLVSAPHESIASATVVLDVDTDDSAGSFLPSSFGYAGAPHVFTSSGSNVSVIATFSLSLAPALCVVDGRGVFSSDVLSCSATACACTLDATRFAVGVHTVALYHGLTLLGWPVTVNLTATPTAAATGLLQRGLDADAFLRNNTPAGSGSLGIYYTSYQQVAASLYQNASALLGRNASSVEDVFRNDSLFLADSIWRYQAAVASPAYREGDYGLFQHQPALGYYCYYRKRPNETYGYLPDCAEASSVLRTHAAEMSSIGMQFVTPDATNWEQDPRNASDGSDLNQLRPTEVLAEEWMQMRLQGQATPQLGTDDLVTHACTENCLYNWYLSEFFNNASYLDVQLMMSKGNSSQLVYLVVQKSSMDMGAITDIMINGGRNNILVVPNWCAPGPDPAWYNNGIWTYFAPCVVDVQGSPVFSNDVPIDLSVPCGHFKTVNSVVGSEWTVSTGIAMANNPFGSATKLNGLFFKKQWWDVFADPVVDYIWMPSWNEFLVGPNNMSGWAMTNPWFYSIGAQPDDPDRYLMFFDGWGAERSRTVEPSVEDDGFYYELLASCMRVYRVQMAQGIVGNGTGCSIAGEECCTVRENEMFTRVWSVERVDFNDSSVTNSAAELAALVSGVDGGSWAEVCSPWGMVDNGQATGFCTNTSAPWLAATDADAYKAAVRGPFIAYANSSSNLPGTHALFRCVNSTAAWPRHFVAGDVGCAGMGLPEYVLAYVGSSRDGLMVREVRRCWAPAAAGGVGVWYHAVNGPCFTADVDEGIQGFGI